MIKRRMFLAVTALAISGCPNGAKAPSAADLAAGVELGAVVVHTVDLACAGAAKGLRDAGKDQEAATLAGTCVKALRDAQAGLEGAARAIDAGTSVSTKDWACAIVNAANSVASLAPILINHGAKLGAKVQRYAEFANLIGGACHG